MINKIVLILLSLATSVPLLLHALYRVQANNYRFDNNLKWWLLSAFGLLVSLFITFALYSHPLIGSALCAVTMVSTSVTAIIFYAKKRTKFKFTARGVRLVVAIIIIELIFKVISACVEPLLGAFIATLTTFSSYLITSIANSVLAPFERMRNRSYAKEMARALDAPEIIKIGITGSYAKTSCKRILSELLKERYEVIATEGNYNTPLGIAKTIKNNQEKLKNARFSAKPIVFIAEMGARRRGDITELCKLVQPNYGIITGVNGQHLKTFKTMDGVYGTKKELADYIEGRGGTVVFNGDNFYTLKMSRDFTANAVVAGLVKGNFLVKELSTTSKGSSFKICYGDELINIKTKLLGAHNALNVVLCVALAITLGVSKDAVNNAINGLKPIEHRLSVTENGGITIIDDGYNANLDGVMSALDVLQTFDGRKVVYAQGIVEQGKMQRAVNERIGEEISKRAEIVILSGVNQKYVESGLIKGGFKGEIYRFSSLMHAQAEFKNILKRGDVLLLQNDIP